MTIAGDVPAVLQGLRNAGGRFVSARERPLKQGVLVRVEMPDVEAAMWGRGIARGAGLAVSGNDDTQVTFTIPAGVAAQLQSGSLSLAPVE